MNVSTGSKYCKKFYRQNCKVGTFHSLKNTLILLNNILMKYELWGVKLLKWWYILVLCNDLWFHDVYKLKLVVVI